MEYDKHIYTKKRHKDYSDKSIGSQVLMRYDKQTDNLLYINEDVEGELNASYLILIAGIIIAIIGLRKK
jgi:hypothetical protein